MPGRCLLFLLTLGCLVAFIYARRSGLPTDWARRLWLAFTLCSLSLLVISCFAFRPSKDLNLARLKTEFQALPHPIDSELIQTYSEMGLIEGNSNHCDYFVAQLRRSSLSEKQIQAHYQQLHLTAPERQHLFHQSEAPTLVPAVFPARVNDTEQTLVFEASLSEQWAGIPYIVKDIASDPPPEAFLNKQALYLVFVLDGGYPASDLRCH